MKKTDEQKIEELEGMRPPAEEPKPDKKEKGG